MNPTLGHRAYGYLMYRTKFDLSAAMDTKMYRTKYDMSAVMDTIRYRAKYMSAAMDTIMY